jgi:hypothetical protein
MPAWAPRSNSTKKREQLQRREQELTHAVQSGSSRVRLVQAAEGVRAAQLSLLKAELYWAENEKIRGRDVEGRVGRLQNDLQRWSEKSVDQILHDYVSR